MVGKTHPHGMVPVCVRSLWCVILTSMIYISLKDNVDGNLKESDSEEEVKRVKKKPVVKLEVGDDERPLLPNTVLDGSLGFDDLHPMVREYMTMNYSVFANSFKMNVVLMTFTGLDSGNPKGVIPWAAISSDQTAFIDEQYLPFQFKIQKDPSKMNKVQVLTLLEYWFKRQTN